MSDYLKSSSPLRPEGPARPSRRGRVRRVRPQPDADLLQFIATGEQPAKRPGADAWPTPEPSEKRYLPTWHTVVETTHAEAVASGPASVGAEAPARQRSVPAIVHEPLFPARPTSVIPTQPSTESVLSVIRRRAGTILALTVLFWSLLAAYITLVPPVYESAATLMIDTRGFRAEMENLPRLSDGAGIGAGAGAGAVGTPKIANQALLLQSSPEIAQATAERLVAAGGPGLTILEDLPARGQKEEIIRRMRDNYVTVQAQQSDDDEPDAIHVRVRSTSPREASLLANTFAREYVGSVERSTTRHFEEATSWYMTRLDEQALVLGTLDARLAAFVATDGSVLFDEEATHLIRQIASLRADLDDARVNIRQSEAKLESFETELGDMGPQLMAERVAKGLQEEIDQTNARIAEVELEAERYYTRNPELRLNPTPSSELVKLLEEAASLRIRVESLSQQYVSEIVSVGGVDLRSHDGSVSYMAQLRRSLAEERIALSGARARESALTSRLVEYDERRRQLPGKTVDYKQIQQERDDAYRTWSDLENRLNAVQEAERSRRSFAQIVAPAVPAEHPVRSPMTIALLGAVLGLLVAGGAGYGLDKRDDRIYTDVHLANAGAPTIGFIPAVSKNWFPSAGRTVRRSFGDRQVSTDIATLTHPSSTVSRAWRRIQLHMDEAQTILVTSAEALAGKSTSATNLAVAFAQAGKRTVLVDANVYHPSVIRLLGLGDQAEFDLASCSFTNGPHVDRFSELLPNLYAVALTGAPDGSSEYLLSTHFVPFLERLKGAFDVIIVDSPPALDSSDALRLAKLVDKTLLIVRAGQSETPSVQAVSDDIRQASGHEPDTIMVGYMPDHIRIRDRHVAR